MHSAKDSSANLTVGIAAAGTSYLPNLTSHLKSLSLKNILLAEDIYVIFIRNFTVNSTL